MGPGRERGVDGSCQLICDWLADGLITSIMMHTSRYSAQVSSLNDCCLIPTHIYSTRPWSFHCPHVEWDSGSTFDYWRSRSRNIPIQGHNIWPWVLLCTLLARVRDIETIFTNHRPLGGGGRRGIWCPKGAHQIPLRLCDQGVTGRGPHPSFRARIIMRV